MAPVSAFGAADVSVVVPVFNRADKVGAVFDTVFLQSALPGELVLVDDGSTDGTADQVRALLPAFADLGVDVRLIEQTNGGPGAARNTGVAASTRRLIAFLDSDDQWRPHKTARQLDLFNSARATWPDLALVDTFAEIVEDGMTVGTQRKRKEGRAFEDFVRRNAVNATSSVLCRRDALLEAGGFDLALRYAEDRLLWMKIAHRHPIVTLPEVMVRKINTPNNLTSAVERNLAYKQQFVETLIATFPELAPRRDELVRHNLLPFVNALAQGERPQKAAALYGRLVRRDPTLLASPEALVAVASLFGKGSVRALAAVGAAFGKRRRFRPNL